MAQFTDSLGREWRLRITMADLKALKAAGLDVAAVAGDPAALQAVAEDFEQYGRVLWELCSAQARAANVSPEDFARGFDGPALFAAAGAIEEAVWDFTRPPPIAKKFAEKRGETMSRLMTEATAKLDAILTGLSASAGSSPAAPASMPGPGLSAN